MPRRRIQPKPTVELETVTLRLPVQLVRAVDHYAKYLGGSTDRTYVMAQAIEIAMAQDRDFQKTLTSRAAVAVPDANGPRTQTARNDPRLQVKGG